MDWKKAFGLGVVFWILMFVIVSIFIAFNFYTNGEPNIIIALIAGIVSYFLSAYAKPKNITEALKLGFTWVIVGLILDGIVTTRFSATVFQMWTLWLGYGLALLAPALRVSKK